MIAIRNRGTLLATVTLVAAASIGGTGIASAATVPIKLVLSSGIGWEVNRTKVEAGAPRAERDVCTAASGDLCQPGVESSEPGGFAFPRAVAVDNDAADVAHYGHVYVADQDNNRVQELGPGGEFIGMFGKEVNETKKTNLCTETEIEAEHVKCQRGSGGTGPEVVGLPGSIAVDPASGTVYVGDSANQRVDAYTSSGAFLWSVGVGGAFGNEPSLTAGGPEHLLYVGGEVKGLEMVQEFEASGALKREVEVGGAVSAIAVDAMTGEMYVLYSEAPVVHRLEPDGKQAAEFSIEPGPRGGEVEAARGLALDSSGHLVVGAQETLVVPGVREESWFGALYDARAGERVTELQGWGTGTGIAFNTKGELYAAVPIDFETAQQEVFVFKPVPIGELVLTNTPDCKPGASRESDATFECTLRGGIDPWGVPETKAWFQWGLTTALGNETAPIEVPVSKGEGEEEPLTEVSASIGGLRPNETPLYYRLAGHDRNLESELLVSRTGTFGTPTVPPRIVGSPAVQFVKSSSAVMLGQINPENAPTRYAFQYAPDPDETCTSLQAGCPDTAETASLEASVYGQIGATREARGLQPAATYRYRLVAVNGKDEHAAYEDDSESVFTTAPAPSVVAQTGGAGAIGTTSALISGSVDPEGAPATYVFELGVYGGATTQYGVVASGPVGSSTAPVEESLVLSGLQPGTRYAYRIAIRSGYGESTGAPVVFETSGTPSVLPQPLELSQLAVPAIRFPTAAKPPGVKCKRGYVRSKEGKSGRCVKIKKRGRGANKTHKGSRHSRRSSLATSHHSK